MSIVVIGGYGVFGSRIVADLVDQTDHRIAVAGRNYATAQALCEQLGDKTYPVHVDLSDQATVRGALADASVVVLAAGPFQELPNTVLDVAVELGIHYIDLTDSRAFLARVHAQKDRIEAANITVLSGLSSFSGISGPLAYMGKLALGGCDTVHISLSPGNRNPKGVGTIKSILSYVGTPLNVWKNGQYAQEQGWSDPESVDFPSPIGRRIVYWADGPDYDILPTQLDCRYVIFKAGLELSLLNHGISALAWVRKQTRLSFENYASVLIRLSDLLGWTGTPFGGIQVKVTYQGKAWGCAIVAEENGPRVAALPSAIAAAQLMDNMLLRRGLIPLTGWIDAGQLIDELRSRGLTVVTWSEEQGLRQVG